MKLHLSLKLLSLAICLGFSHTVFAQEAEEEGVQVQNDPPLVQVEISQDTLAPYVERREDTGVYFGITYEALDLKNYVSVLDNTNVKYADAFGSNPVALIIVTTDYKYNTSFGSLAAGLNVGTGEVSSSKSGVSRKLNVMKYGVDFRLTLDTLWPEPYVAPYVGLNLWQMGIKDTTPTDSVSVTTQLGYNYTLGFLLQLDWIDYDAAKTSTFSWGMENTFVDVYATQYAKSSADTDPNTETDFIYGVGLRLEF